MAPLIVYTAGIPGYGFDSWDDSWGYYRPRWWLPLWNPLRPGWVKPPIFNRPGPLLPIRPPPPGWRPGSPLPGWRPGNRVRRRLALHLLLLLLFLYVGMVTAALQPKHCGGRDLK